MPLPGPLRAAVGLLVTTADEARRLPERALGLPVLAVGTAVQLSMRAQQRYAALAARGEQALRRGPTDEPPGWATFDEPVAPTPRPPSPFDVVDVVDGVDGVDVVDLDDI